MKSKILLTIMICMAVFSLSAQQDDNFDYGSIKEAVYTNSYFGITVPFPNSWHVQIEKQMKKMLEEGNKVKAGCKVADVGTANLLTVSKYKAERVDDYNTCFMVIAENLSAYPDVKSALDYLFHVKVLSMQLGIYNKINENFIKKDIGGKKFYEMTSEIIYDEMKMVHKQYACIMNGFILSIVMYYASDQGSRDVHAILNKVKFKKI